MTDIQPVAPPVQVLLVDDHQLVLEGIKTLLKNESDIRIVAQATSGAEALRQLAAHPEVEVAVLDLNMPEMSGVELTRAISSTRPLVRVLVLSMFHDHASVTDVLAAGGRGYLLKTTTRDELAQAIQQVAQGHTYFSSEISAELLDSTAIMARQDQRASGPAAELTTRELEVLRLVAREYSNQAIAEELFISERTVETHRKNMLTKTGSKSVVGLIQYALRHQFIR